MLVALVFVGRDPAKIERMIIASVSVDVIDLLFGLIATSPEGVHDSVRRVMSASDFYGIVPISRRRTCDLILFCSVDLSGISQP